jgi:ribosome biogenesis protein UTP30
MGKKIEKESNLKTNTNSKTKEDKKTTNTTTKKGKKEQTKKNTKDTKDIKLPKDTSNDLDIIQDEKILNDKEEAAIVEDIKANYEKSFEEIKENLPNLLDSNLIKNAIKCLKKIILDKYKDNLNLLQSEQEEFVYLNFVFGKLPFKFSLRPVNIPLKNSIYGEKYNSRVCIFVKDPSSAFKELEIYKSFPFKVKVIDIEKLKTKYSRFQERRNLLKEYELFLCDQKIYMLLKKHLGKPFYVQKKYPVPLKLDYSQPEEIKKLIISHVENSTNFYMSHGPNYTVKFSRAVQSAEEIYQNLNDAMINTIPHIIKWGGVTFQE